MCGLIGVVGRAPSAVIDAALDSIAHRGPDGRGLVTNGEVTLGHRRLSIVDLAGGAQPMRHHELPITIAFNGEIYNHLALRDDLSGRGHAFHTTSDTETLLAAYVEYGEACVDRLRGMFAFVIHDERRHVLFGARDPFGKKPLYWGAQAEGDIRFAIASEPRALLALWPSERPQLSMSGIISYLRHDYVTGSRSAFEGIQRIAPGTAFRLELSAGPKVAIPDEWTFWKPATSLGAAATGQREGEALDRLEQLLTEAVDRRLMSDVPLGVLLSGGIDSTIIAALATRLVGRDRVKSFSIGFRDKRFDESVYAEEVAHAVGTVHRCKFFDADDVVAAIDDVMPRMDEPFADPSILPTAMLCAFAREEVTVALGGDGGDELFAGYDTFSAIRPALVARQLVPRWADRVIAASVGVMGTESQRTHMPLEFKARRFLRGYRFTDAEMFTAWQGPFDGPGMDRLLPDVDWRKTEPSSSALRATFPSTDVAALHWYQTVYLPDDILVKGDRASMQHSLELRCPFLDVDLAEFVNALPFTLKMQGGTRKYLLRMLIERWGAQGHALPAHVLKRPKKGFGIPVASWLRGPLRATMERILGPEWPAPLAFVSAAERERLITLHVNGSQNLWKEIWSLLVLAQWTRAWLK